MALLYGRAGRLTTNNGGFRPGQSPGPNEISQFHVADQKNAKGEKRVHESILADTRWPALRGMFAAMCPANASITDAHMKTFESWDPLGLRAQCWNEVMTHRSAAGMDEAFFKPLWKAFPKATGSNFCHWHKKPGKTWAFKDWGHTTSSLLGDGAHVGTSSSSPFYGAGIAPPPAANSSRRPAPVEAPPQIIFATPTWQESTALEPFTVLLAAVRRARNILSGSPAGVGLQPWYTAPNGTFPGGVHVLEGNGYFAEMVFHTAVSACTRELLWWVHGSDLNKHKTTADPDGLRFGLGE